MDDRRARTASLHSSLYSNTSSAPRAVSAVRRSRNREVRVNVAPGIESRRLQPLRVEERVGVFGVAGCLERRSQADLPRPTSPASRDASALCRSNSCTTATQPAPSLLHLYRVRTNSRPDALHDGRGAANCNDRGFLCRVGETRESAKVAMPPTPHRPLVRRAKSGLNDARRGPAQGGVVNYNALMPSRPEPCTGELGGGVRVGQEDMRSLGNNTDSNNNNDTPGREHEGFEHYGVTATGTQGSPSPYLTLPMSASTRMPAGGQGSMTSVGFMEGPLPPQVRELIQQSCTGTAAEEAERQARRLLSTSRRMKVYRDELVAANDESTDLEQVVQGHVLVCSALRTELAEIDAKVQQLLNERRICEVQLQQEESEVSRQQSKLNEARERVAVLRNTVENITRETQMNHIVLRQLVPHLNIENYTS